MVSCYLRWSRVELSLVLFSHLVALLSVLAAAAAVWLQVLMALLVSGSLAVYLRERFRIFFTSRRGGVQCSRPTLQLAREFARVSCGEEPIEMAPPRVHYSSELLLVLSLRPVSTGIGSRKLILLLWPDSLDRAAGRRLRRYLRFELVGSLEEA